MRAARRGALAVITALAALSYSWALGRDPLEPYYEAAVRSMSTSWHNFVFGAFDPAGTITVDKLPGALWVQALSVRVFGFHPWAIVAPQAIEGALTVLVLYRAVRRLAGPTAGLVAAFVVAVSPATVALDRGNISDTLMILLLVLAADAVSNAVVTGSRRWLGAAAVWVGLAFQAKMIEAWLVLPALGLAYLIAGPGATRRRAGELAAAGALAAVVSLSWMTAVSLVPAGHRPYVDGSHHDSEYSQVFVYNGLGRFGEQTPLQLLAGQSFGFRAPTPIPAAGPTRLFHGGLGRDTGWLLPAALVLGLAGLVSRWREPRRDELRAGLVLWGGWLLTLGVTFSAATTINTYYTAALSPAIAAVIALGGAALWSARAAEPAQGSIQGSIPGATLLTGPILLAGWAVIVAATLGFAYWLLPSTGNHLPGWLGTAALVVGVVAVVVVLAVAVVRREAVSTAAIAAGLAAVAFVPAVASIGLAANHEGAFDTPFEPAQVAVAVDNLFIGTPAHIKQTIPALESAQYGAPYLMAVQTAAVASVFIDESGLEALPIGGFTGTIPSPTLAQLKADIRAGRFHLVVSAPSSDPRLQWIAAHCRDLPLVTGVFHNYYCLPADAR